MLSYKALTRFAIIAAVAAYVLSSVKNPQEDAVDSSSFIEGREPKKNVETRIHTSMINDATDREHTSYRRQNDLAAQSFDVAWGQVVDGANHDSPEQLIAKLLQLREQHPQKQGFLDAEIGLLKLHEQGNDAEAIVWLENALNTEKNQPDALKELVIIYIENGLLERGAEVFERILSTTTTDEQQARYSGALGQIYATSGRSEEAISLLEDSIETIKDPKIATKLAELYANDGRLEQAIEAQQIAIASFRSQAFDNSDVDGASQLNFYRMNLYNSLLAANRDDEAASLLKEMALDQYEYAGGI